MAQKKFSQAIVDRIHTAAAATRIDCTKIDEQYSPIEAEAMKLLLARNIERC